MSVTINTGEKAKRDASTIAFPYGDLDDAIAIAEGLLKGGGVPLSRDQLAAAMNQAPGGGGFATKVATAKTFGVIDSASGKYELTDIGFEIVDPSRHSDAKIKAFFAVPLYKKIYDEFRGRLLPPRPHGLERAIVNFGVAEKSARNARQAFERSARTAGFYPGGNEDRLVVPFGIPLPQIAGASAATNDQESSGAATTSTNQFKEERPLEYQLIDLLDDEGIREVESDAIWTLVRYLKRAKK